MKVADKPSEYDVNLNQPDTTYNAYLPLIP